MEPAIAERLKRMSLLDPEVQDDPFELYGLLQQHAPVYRMPENGVFLVSRYEDVRAVLLDPQTFSNRFGKSIVELQGPEGMALYEKILREEGWPHSQSLQNADDPLHAKHRKLVEGAFNKASVRRLEQEIDALCHALIDDFIEDGECEFVSQFAMPLPGKIVAGLIGLDPTELPLFKRWADALLSVMTRVLTLEEVETAARTELELQHFLARTLEDRRAHPQDDLLTVIATQAVDGEGPLPMVECLFLMRQVIAAGFDTTLNALAHGMWLLLRYPDQMAKLRADPALIPRFIDESIRFESPVQGLFRRATKDTEISGVRIPAESMVMIRYGAANRDAKVFECPHRFDIERRNAGNHLGFGMGAHFCVGRILAKQELKAAFEALLGRLDDIQLSRPLPSPAHHADLILRPIKELPIRFLQRPARAGGPQSSGG